MKRLLTDKKFNIFYSVFAVLLMWAVWLIVAVSVGNEYLVPDFPSSVREFFTLFIKGFFWKSLGWSLLRTVIAFALSFLLALGCALLALVFKPFAAFMRPIVALFRTLPTMAVLILILVWLTPRTAPIAVTSLVLFPMIYTQITLGIESVDGGLLAMAKVYRLTAKQKLTCIYLPHLAPQTVEQMGVNLSFGLKLTISAEVMASTYTALGGMMSEAQAYLNLPRVTALTLVSVLLGVGLEVAFRLLSALPYRRARGANAQSRRSAL